MTVQERIIAARKASSFHVRVDYDGREPLNYFAKDVSDRDAFVTKYSSRINASDPLGHVIRSVVVVL